MAFADVFAGYQEAAGQHYQNLLQMDYENKRKLADTYSQLAQDPRYAPEQQQEFQKRALSIPTMQPMQKMPKEWDNMMIKVQPSPVGPAPIPGQAGAAAPMMQPGAPTAPPIPGGEGGPLPPGPLQQGIHMPGQMQPPTPELAPMSNMPPSQMTPLMQQLPYPEQLRRAQVMALAKGAPSVFDTVIKEMKGLKIGQYPTLDPKDGQAYQVTRFRGLDPASINMQAIMGGDMSGLQQREWEERGQQPLRPFAPRAVSTAGLNAEDVAYAIQNDVPLSFTHDPTPAEMAKVREFLPNAQLIHTGMGQWYVAAPHWTKTVGANGHTLLFNNVQPATDAPLKYIDAGIAPSGMEHVTEPSVRGVTPQGTMGATPSIRTPQLPGGRPIAPVGGPSFYPGAPVPPLGQKAPAFRINADMNAAPEAVRTELNQRRITPEGLNFLVSQNPGMAANQILQNLTTGATPDTTFTNESGMLPMPTPPVTTPQGSAAQTPPPPPPQNRQNEPLYNAGTFNRERQMLAAVNPASHILFGDPGNPNFQSLASFAPLMANADSRNKVSTAVRTIMEGLGRINKSDDVKFDALKLVGISTGNIGQIIGDHLGLPAAEARAETQVINDAVGKLNEQERALVARLFTAYGTISGYRKFTGAGAYQFSMASMDRELPVPGQTEVNSPQSFRNKLAGLAQEVDGALQATVTIPKEYKDFIHHANVGLTAGGRGYKVTEQGGQWRIQKENKPGAPIFDENDQVVGYAPK